MTVKKKKVDPLLSEIFCSYLDSSWNHEVSHRVEVSVCVDCD